MCAFGVTFFECCVTLGEIQMLQDVLCVMMKMTLPGSFDLGASVLSGWILCGKQTHIVCFNLFLFVVCFCWD